MSATGTTQEYRGHGKKNTPDYTEVSPTEAREGSSNKLLCGWTIWSAAVQSSISANHTYLSDHLQVDEVVVRVQAHLRRRPPAADSLTKAREPPRKYKVMYNLVLGCEVHRGGEQHPTRQDGSWISSTRRLCGVLVRECRFRMG